MSYSGSFTLVFMKNIILGQKRIFGPVFQDIVRLLKTTSRAQRDESSLEVWLRPNKLASEVSPKWPS